MCSVEFTELWSVSSSIQEGKITLKMMATETKSK